MTTFVVVSSLLLIGSVGQLARAESTTVDSIPEVLSRYFGHRSLPEITAAEIDELRAGLPVVWTPQQSGDKDKDSELGIIGLKVVDAPRLLVWLSLLAETEYLNRRVTRAVLLSEPGGLYVRYHHVNLPWPITNRHWVVRIRNDVDLAASSGDLVWERHWRLDDNGWDRLHVAYANDELPVVTQRMLDKSVYLPSNNGAWAVVDLGADGTLVIAYVDATLGGYIPDSLVRGYTRRKLRAGLAALSDERDFMNPAYDENPVIYDGHGSPISLKDALEARQRWEAQEYD